MHPASTLSFICALFLPIPFLINVGAIHPYALSRQVQSSGKLKGSSIVASRQHTPTRALIDICASVDLGLLADTGGLLGPGLLDELLTELHLCLCLQDLDLYLDTDLNLQLLAGVLGRDALTTSLIAMINTSPTKQECILPPHARRTCNNQDVCHYDCDKNYVRIGDSCVCATPFSVCNGVCGYFPSSCASPVPHHPRAQAPRVTSPTKSQAACKPHETICETLDRGDFPTYKCLDVKTATNSCGGCISRQPFLSAETQVIGANCHAIPHVEEVSCVEGRCVVKACAAGWVRTPQQAACVEGTKAPRRIKKRMHEPVRIAADGRGSPDAGNRPGYEEDIGPNRALRRDSSAYTAFLSPDLSQGLLTVVNLMIDMEARYSPPSSPSSSTSGSDPGLNDDMLRPLLASLQAVLASPTVTDLVSSIDLLLDTSTVVNATLAICGCATDMVLDLAGQLATAVLDLQQLCQTHAVAYILSQSPPGPGVGGYGTTTDFSHSGTPAACTTTPTLSSPSPTPTMFLPQDQVCFVSQVPNDSEAPIVLSLNKLLASLGLGSLESVTMVDGLGSGAAGVVNGLLDDFHIGPHEMKKRGTIVGDGAMGRDQEFALLLSALTKLVLDLGVTFEISSARDILTSGTCVNASSASTHVPTAAVTPAPDFPLGISSESIDQLIGAMAEILASTTLSSLIPKIDIFLETSYQLQALTGYPLVDALTRITDAALRLRSWCLDYGSSSSADVYPSNAASPPSSPASISKPASDYSPSSPAGSDAAIVIGFNKFLAAFGLNTFKTSVQVSGFGNEVGGFANGLLDGLGIEPAGAGLKKGN